MPRKTRPAVRRGRGASDTLEFEGFDDLSYASLDLEETSDGTKVTWGFDSQFGGFFKYFGLFMDGMLGPTYEEGLTNLKQVAEKRG